VVIEAGAGTGRLAASVLDAVPACATALHYVLVERAEALQSEQAARLHLEPAGQVLGPVVVADPDEGAHPAAGTGPVATALCELPAGTFTGVVLANELLDNLPFRLLERRSRGWQEVLVGEDGGRLRELLVDAPPELVADAERLAPHAPDGGRIPLQRTAMDWLRQALTVLRRGRVVILDYADTTPSLAARPWSEWLRTYRGHGRGGAPLEHPGEQDVTCEVAVDQLAHVRPPVSDRSQADFLTDHGIERTVERAREEWRERAHIGDLAAMKARSRVGEADALTDPTGLGAFRVLEWTV
jgi:SAM-dependent MidA family methyltransferase